MRESLHFGRTSSRTFRLGLVLILALAMAALGAVEASWAGPQKDRGGKEQMGRVALVQVSTTSSAERQRLAALELDGGIGKTGPGYANVVLIGDADRAALRRAGFTSPQVLVPDLEERNRKARQAELQRVRKLPGAAKVVAPQQSLSPHAVMPPQIQRRALPPQAASQGKAKPQAASSLPSGRVTYRTLPQINNELRYLARTYPEKVELFSLPHRSLLGSKIWGIEITHDVDADTGKPVFLMTGIHHAREWPTAEFSMEFAWHLLLNDGSNPRVTGLLDQVRVIIVPVVNPDGFTVSRSLIQEYKRKNCRVEPGKRPRPGQCSNPANFELGVDLNRNYGAYWGGVGASPERTAYNYRGAAPFSEPAIKNMKYLVTHNPVTVFISNHTPDERVLRAPANHFEPVPPDVEQYQGLAEAMAAENGYKPGPWDEIYYEGAGVAEQFGWYVTGTFSYTFELAPGDGGFHPPYPTVIAEWPENLDAYMIGLEAAAAPDTHAVISGSAPENAVLKLRKEFTMYTAPVLQAGGGRGPILPFPVKTEVSMTVADDGEFRWHVPPSLRPSEFRSAYIQESYTLTCARPDGEVLQTTQVTVARGQHVSVDLSRCAKQWER